MDTTKNPIYPIEPWVVRETLFNLEDNYRNETTFALSNGYIGTRGTFEEAYGFDVDTGLEGNFINGFYESEDIRYGEANFGSPKNSQSLLNLPNMKEIRLQIQGETFDMRQGTMEEYARALRMKDGILERSLVWTSPKGRRVKLCIRRLVSFRCKHLMETSYQVTPLNFSGTISFTSALQADVENHTRKTNPIVDYGPFGRHLDPIRLEATEDSMIYIGRTKNSGLTMACGCSHRLYTGGDGRDSGNGRDGRNIRDGRGGRGSRDGGIMPRGLCYTGNLDASISWDVEAAENETVTLEKYMAYMSQFDTPVCAMEERIWELLEEAGDRGFEKEEEDQKSYMGRLWESADVTVKGDDALVQGMRFNLFHIMQAAGRDGRTGMGAKGLTGEGYEGHYFWDTEMYVLPVFIYTNPELAKKLLDYRYGTLEQARARARILGHDRGALFPWRTINGEEASTYYPLGTAQYHINGDISYALCLYMDVTGDVEYLKEKGAEILIETARVWADVGSFAKCRGGKYCICDVTGPDEYNVLVDNNFYTNLLARENLRAALKAVEYLQKEDVSAYQALAARIGFQVEETRLWRKIVDNMYFPYDEERQIYPLDDGFMMRKPWDESKIPPEKRAWLYENYHPLFIMRHRMSKQADSMLGFYLYGNLFTKEEIKRNYDFYQEVTLHHSSLSTCIFGIVASQIGYEEEAYEYFSQSARMDLDDYHNNVYAGIHAANMAGTWQAVVCGFAGLGVHDGILSFHPTLPEKWEGYSFKIKYRGRLLAVDISRDKAAYTLERGDGIQFQCGAGTVCLGKEGDSHYETI